MNPTETAQDWLTRTGNAIRAERETADPDRRLMLTKALLELADLEWEATCLGAFWAAYYPGVHNLTPFAMPDEAVCNA